MLPAAAIQLADDPDARCAAAIAGRLRVSVKRRGMAKLAVSGGSSAPAMFAHLAALDVPWDRVGIWQVDERVAPDGDRDRNADQLVALGGEHQLMPVTADDLVIAAERYGAGLPDRFDVVHLGMGADGHTASWPPGDPVIDSEQLVALTRRYAGRVRMTLTPPVVNRARARVVLARAGQGRGAARLGRRAGGRSDRPPHAEEHARVRRRRRGFAARDGGHRVKLDVACSIGLGAPWPTPVVLMLSPRSGEAQHVIAEEFLVEPFHPWHEYVDSHGNRCHRLTVPTGRSTVTVRATVDAPDAIDVDATAPRSEGDDLPDWVLEFCLPSRYCQSDLLVDRARAITVEALPGYPQVEAIRAWIERNVRYEYNTSSASTSALDTLGSGAGVCRDFAHLGIALCRALDIPARMVVGYLNELVPMDQHAWFEAYVGNRWYTFDATQREPRGNRVAVGYGRDAADVAFVTQFGTLELTDMWVSVAPTP